MEKPGEKIQNLILILEKTFKKKNSNIWKTILENLKRSRKNRVKVNLDRLSRYGKEDKFIIVPGKVLGSGRIEKKLKIAAIDFTHGSKVKIEQVGGECLNITELINKKIEGKDIMIIR
jgi:large subunit ribosomal protein L18e